MDQLMELLNSDKWPEAVPSFLICKDTEEDKFERAEGILGYINENFKNKKLLDFGCGEGHVIKKNIFFGVGYDVIQTGNLSWEKFENESLLTTDFKKVEEHSPYDFILLYDVLDHAENPVEVLNIVKTVSNKNTKIYVRCHPWMARHGGHLYKEKNKAYIHIIFTEAELATMGLYPDYKQKTYYPKAENKKWFDAAGLKIINQNTIQSIVEDFFKSPQILERLPTLDNKKFPEWQMSQSFNDYVLKL